MTIVIGGWIVPLIFSLVAIAWAAHIFRTSKGGYDFGPAVALPVSGMIVAGSWLVYFAVRFFLEVP